MSGPPSEEEGLGFEVRLSPPIQAICQYSSRLRPNEAYGWGWRLSNPIPPQDRKELAQVELLDRVRGMR